MEVMANSEESTHFQQLMSELLGDRDYDSIDYDELNLLKEKIGYALYGAPRDEKGYDNKQQETISFLYEIIMRENNLVNKWENRVIITYIFIWIEPLSETKKNEQFPVPIFVLRKCKRSANPCRIFIDNMGRVYKSWKKYLEENKLPECKMIYPKNGKYMLDKRGKVLLESSNSPACGIDKKIVLGADIASTVGGIASGGIFVATAIPAIVVAPVALITAGILGAGVGVYSIGRSAYTIHDKRMHKESLSLANSEARSAYLNIVAGSLGFIGTGASIAVTELAARGVYIGSGARAAFDVFNVANLGTNGFNMVNATNDVIQHWKKEKTPPSALALVQLSSSVLFFGHAVYSFKSATTLVNEAQINSLKVLHESLGSKKQQKAFINLLGETIRQNDGDAIKGQAEVIKSLTNIGDTEKIFATLASKNKLMNENDVRFAVKDGAITLNGVPVDIGKLNNLEENQVITYLKGLPEIPNSAQPNVKAVETILQQSFKNGDLIDIQKYALGIFQIMRNADLTIMEKIIKTVVCVVDAIIGDPLKKPLCDLLDKIFPGHSKFFSLLNMVIEFFQGLVNEEEEKYQRWKKDPTYENSDFIELDLDFAKRAVQFFSIVSNAYFIGTTIPTKALIEILLEYSVTWITKQYYLHNEREERKLKRKTQNTIPAKRVACCQCDGYYYSRK